MELAALQASAIKRLVEVVCCACGHGSWGFVSLVVGAGARGLWLCLQLHSYSSVVGVENLV